MRVVCDNHPFGERYTVRAAPRVRLRIENRPHPRNEKQYVTWYLLTIEAIQQAVDAIQPPPVNPDTVKLDLPQINADRSQINSDPVPITIDPRVGQNCTTNLNLPSSPPSPTTTTTSSGAAAPDPAVVVVSEKNAEEEARALNAARAFVVSLDEDRKIGLRAKLYDRYRDRGDWSRATVVSNADDDTLAMAAMRHPDLINS